MDGVARLPADDRAAMFEATAAGRHLANARIVEKDFWVCWTLHKLYAIPAMPRLLFKGGTSLSKCFGLIHRFSEDIDLGMERGDIGLVGELDPMAQPSRKRSERAREAMTAKVHEYVAVSFFPAIKEDFRDALDEDFVLHPPESDAKEPSIRFEYPRALEAASYGPGDPVASVVRLELGARSDHEPVRTIGIRPYVADGFESEFSQPTCTVVAQAPERTLLEKAFILHAAIHKGRIKRQSSRHAYDLAMMVRDESTMAAVTRELYERVAHHKFVFGESTTVRHALTDGIRLVPEGDALRDLGADYRGMQSMLFSDPAPPSFADVVAGLAALETALRSL